MLDQPLIFTPLTALGKRRENHSQTTTAQSDLLALLIFSVSANANCMDE